MLMCEVRAGHLAVHLVDKMYRETRFERRRPADMHTGYLFDCYWCCGHEWLSLLVRYRSKMTRAVFTSVVPGSSSPALAGCSPAFCSKVDGHEFYPVTPWYLPSTILVALV